MTREEKTVIINELKEKFAANNFFYITDASGMSVEQVNKFRRMCFERGVEYVVVKNTLIAKALETHGDYADFSAKVLKGFSGIMFYNENGKAPAVLLKDFYKESGAKDVLRPVLKGASIEGAPFIGADQLDALSKIKSREELIGEIVGLLQSPAKNVVSALQSGGGKLAGILKTLGDRAA